MNFPFAVHFEKKLETKITSDNRDDILQFIENYLLADKADNIVLEDMSVRYKGSKSIWNVSLYRTVDEGLFSLIYKDNSWFLRYQINLRSLFTDTIIISLMFGVVGQIIIGGMWWIGLVAYLWFCGGNWVINVIGHESIAATIAANIDRLSNPEIEQPEIEKIPGKLKSWF